MPCDGNAQVDSHLQAAHERKRLNEVFKYVKAASRAVDRDLPHHVQHVPRLSADPTLNALAQLGALRLNCDRAFVSLIDHQNQHILAEVTRSISLFQADDHRPGDELCMGDVPLDLVTGVCAGTLQIFTSQTAQTIDTPNIAADQSRYVINDFAQEDMYKNRPYVTAFPHMRYYAEVPLRTKSGYVIGSYCVVDNQPRTGLDSHSFRVLSEVAAAIVQHLELVKTNDDHAWSMRLLDGLHNVVENDGFREKRPSLERSSSSTKALPNGTTSGLDIEFGGQRPATPAKSPMDITQSVDHSPTSLIPAKRPVDDLLDGESARPAPRALEANAATPAPTPVAKKPRVEVPKSKPTKTDSGNGATNPVLDTAALTLCTAMDLKGVNLLDASASSLKSRHKPQTNQTGVESGQWTSYFDQRNQPMDQALSTSLGRSVRAHAFSQTSGPTENLDDACSLPKTIQQTLIRKYPRGNIFNFDENGLVTPPIPMSSDPSLSPRSKSLDILLNRQPEEWIDVEDALQKFLPGVTSAIFLPLWNSHEQGWSLTMFAWTTERARVLLPEELSYCRAFGSTVVAELTRVDLVATDRAKSNFISSISHELRSPLHGILASTELLREMQASPEQSQMIDMINNCGRTLLDTVEHILDYSKINSLRKRSNASRNSSVATIPSEREKPGTLSTFDLSVMVEETVDGSVFGYFHNLASSEQQTKLDAMATSRRTLRRQSTQSDSAPNSPSVTISIGPQPNWTVTSDIAAWRRVISNLVGNSLKYTSSGLIDVSLMLEDDKMSSESDGSKVVTLIVSDTGRGMSQSYLQNHVFTPFVQENNLSSGVGLGLSIVLTLVKSLDGSIDIDSELNKGTKVTIKIPVTTSRTLDLEDEADVQAYTGRSICLYRRTADEQVGADLDSRLDWMDYRNATANSLATHMKDWLHVDVVPIKDMASATPGIIVVHEEDLDWLTTQQLSASSTPEVLAHSCLLVLCVPRSRYIATSFNGARWVRTLAEPFGPQKLFKSLAACFDLIASDWSRPEIPGHEVEPVNHAADQHSKALPPVPSSLFRGLSASGNAVAEHEVTIESESEVLPPSKPRRNLLLVDDNVVNLKLLVAFAKKLNCAFSTAQDGREALSAFKDSPQRFDYVLMDLSMPVMDGFTATSEIRAHERKYGMEPTTVIALTGLGSEEAQQEAARVGIDLFLAKPVRLKQLENLMQLNRE